MWILSLVACAPYPWHDVGEYARLAREVSDEELDGHYWEVVQTAPTDCRLPGRMFRDRAMRSAPRHILEHALAAEQSGADCFDDTAEAMFRACSALCGAGPFGLDACTTEGVASLPEECSFVARAPMIAERTTAWLATPHPWSAGLTVEGWNPDIVDWFATSGDVATGVEAAWAGHPRSPVATDPDDPADWARPWAELRMQAHATEVQWEQHFADLLRSPDLSRVTGIHWHYPTKPTSLKHLLELDAERARRDLQADSEAITVYWTCERICGAEFSNSSCTAEGIARMPPECESVAYAPSSFGGFPQYIDRPTAWRPGTRDERHPRDIGEHVSDRPYQSVLTP